MRQSGDPDVVRPAPSRLAANIIAAEVDGGRIAENIVSFGRLLRASGLNIGTDRIATATEAVLAAGVEDPRTVYWALHASMVSRRADKAVFDQAFMMFWKDPDFLGQLLSLMLPQVHPSAGEGPSAPELSRRLLRACSNRARRTHRRPVKRLRLRHAARLVRQAPRVPVISRR